MKHIAKALAIILSLSINAQSKEYSLRFIPEHYTIEKAQVNGREITFRAYKNIVYVSHPVDIKYQTMNIYIPTEFFENQSLGGYTSATAPIFFPNSVGGYLPAEAGVAGVDKRTGKNNTIIVALSKGYVVAAPGTRGRTTKNTEGKFTGKAPAPIIDLKAAIRYLKYNDDIMAGNANKIISNGTSAGGALSALLGATGNHNDYEPYLKKLGAAPSTDDIFAVSAYCPITNLENADMAYEWQFNGVNEYKKMEISMLDYRVERKLIPGVLTEEQINLSNQLKDLFPRYINKLKLKDNKENTLSLNKDGNGSFKDWVMQYIIRSAQKEIDSGRDLSNIDWLTIKNGKVTAIDFLAYAKAAGRQKTPPAFDGIALDTGENQLFGTDNTDKQHFTKFSQAYNKNNKRAKKAIVKMMNPMPYIENKAAHTAKHWRIRHGTKDRDTSLAISVILATKLQNHNKSVDLEFPWDVQHSGDYDLEELFSWIAEISK